MKTDVKNNGQSLAELAITLPLLLLVVMGVFDFGRGIFYYSTIHNAAREGARYGAVDHCDSIGIQDIVETHAYSLLDGLTVSDTIMYFDAKPERIVVTVTYTFETITPLIGAFLDDGSVELVSQSRQLIEQPGACP
jgi:Flp pilus assembly protein TadG